MTTKTLRYDASQIVLEVDGQRIDLGGANNVEVTFKVEQSEPWTPSWAQKTERTFVVSDQLMWGDHPIRFPAGTNMSAVTARDVAAALNHSVPGMRATVVGEDEIVTAGVIGPRPGGARFILESPIPKVLSENRHERRKRAAQRRA